MTTNQQNARVRQGVLLVVVALVVFVAVLVSSVVWAVQSFHPVPGFFIGVVDAAAIFGCVQGVRILFAARRNHSGIAATSERKRSDQHEPLG